MWYEGLTFAPNQPAKRFTDINEAIKYSQELTVIPTQLPLGELLVNPDATIGNEHRKITKYGFENLCALLGIPKPFAQRIPSDLLFENIRRLKTDNQGAEVVVLSRENGEIASIINAPYKEPSYGEMLSVFQERGDLKYIDLGERLLTVCIAFEDLPLIGENEEDTIYVGSYMYGSVVKETSLRLFSGLYRNKCENSFLCPFLGYANANYKHENATLMMSKFGELIRCYNEVIVNRISSRLNSILEGNKYLWKDEVSYLWTALSKTIGKSEADIVIGFGGEEDRKQLLKDVSLWKSTNQKNRIEGKSVLDPILSPYKSYSVINAITEYSKDNLHELDKREVEKLAGKWVQHLILN